MRLTCCCGASIETDVPEFKLAMQTTLGEPRTIVDRFKTDHAPCLERWRAELHRSHFTPYVAHLFPYTLDELQKRASYGQTINHTMKPIVQHGDQAIKGICCHCGSSMVYRRIDGITVICYSCGKFNVEPPDPYKRFRDAIRDGKRVLCFADKGQGKFYAECRDVTSFYPEQMFIEGVDIPPQPTKDWLDKHGVELNGECRVPNSGDTWVSFTNKSIHEPLQKYDVLKLSISTYGGRRWIVKRKQQDDGFEKWYEENKLSLAFETNPRYSHTVLKRTWTAAQKAKP